MKHFIPILLCLLLTAAVLAGCSCNHQWSQANCQAPKTCTLCNKTEGEIGTHQWILASCKAPKTCKICQITEGEPIDHNWKDATTEAPKTCADCGLTEGQKIFVDSRFQTSACEKLFGTWKATYEINGEETFGMTIDGENLNYTAYITMTFTNDGKLISKTEFEEASFKNVTKLITIETMYETLRQSGYSREEANQEFKKIYQMTIEEYAQKSIDALDMDQQISVVNGVYYVSDNKIFGAESWDKEFDGQTITMLKPDTLLFYMENFSDTLIFTLQKSEESMQ